MTHLDEGGAARMVDVSAKPATARTATASGLVALGPDAVAALRDHSVPKGDVIAVARIAGIQGAKRTAELIPLCHPLPLSSVAVDFEILDHGVRIEATVRTTGPTGVEMEALTAVTVAALTLVDMIKAIDRSAMITDVVVEEKDGGRSGHYLRGQ